MKEPLRSTAPWRRLLSNSGWNLLGLGIGLVAALVAIPLLIRNIGTESFGILSIYLALVGYFGLLDLGIGRAVTMEVARHTSRDDRVGLSSSLATALVLLGLVGLSVVALIAIFHKQIVDLLVSRNANIRNEGSTSLNVLALVVPVVVLTSGLRGALEGLQEFKAVSKITMATGGLMFAGPALVSQFSASLVDLVLTILVVRLAAFGLFLRACRARVDDLRLRRFEWAHVHALLRFGGWVTISNLISPLMTNLDRVIVGARLSMTAVAQYVTPYEMATKVLLPAGSIANATFPEFARLASDAKDRQRKFFWRVAALAFATALVPSLCLFAFSHAILSIWISRAFADSSAQIMRLLVVGVAINGAAYIPFAYIQGMGRADVTAKFHLLEFVAYFPTLLACLSAFGVEGAAIAWVGRVTIDAVLLFTYALGTLRSTKC